MVVDTDKMYCGLIKRGDIFLCEYNNQEKMVAVLQDSVLNRSLPTVTCAIIEPCHKDEDVFPNEVELEENNIWMDKKGICMLHKTVTVDRRLILSKKGELSEEKIKQIYCALDISLGRFRD